MSEAAVKHEWTWRTDGTLTGQHPVIIGEENYFDDGSPRVIAELETTRHRDNSTKRWKRVENADEIERFATMICALHDLLECCREALPHLHWANTHGSRCDEAIASVEAAIAKATGGE